VLLASALSNQLDQKSAAERALPSAPAGTLFWAQELQDLDASYSSALMCIRIPLGPFQSAARLPVPEIALVFGGCNPFQEQWSRSITYQGAIGILCTAHDLLTFPGRLFLLAAVCAVATPPPVPAFHRPPRKTDAAALQAERRHLCGRFGKRGTGAQESPEGRKCDAFQRNNCNQNAVQWDKTTRN